MSSEYKVYIDNKYERYYILPFDFFKQMKLKEVYNEYGVQDCQTEFEEEELLGHTFWNGHNFQTVILYENDEGLNYGDVSEIEAEKEKEILNEYEKIQDWEKRDFGYEAKADKYVFKKTLYQHDFSIAIVEEVDNYV